MRAAICAFDDEDFSLAIFVGSSGPYAQVILGSEGTILITVTFVISKAQ